MNRSITPSAFGRRVALSALAIALLAGTSAGVAQTGSGSSDVTRPTASEPPTTAEPAGGAGDIVVTATRREQSLTQVPLAISAVTGAALDRANVTSFQDLIRVAPSLNIQNYGASFNQFVIRGIVSDTAQTTGLYFDEAPLLGGIPSEGGGDGTPSLRLIDLQRIEVLRGPQGTLFGSGSMAGTIRLITNKPSTDAFGGSVSASVASIKGGHAVEQGNIVLNVPVSRTFAVRVVGWNELGGGYIDQFYNGSVKRNVNDAFVRGGRIEALWKPVEEFTLVASATHQQIKVDGSQNYDRAAGPYVSTAYSQEPFHDNFDLYNLTGTYDLGFGKIVAIGSYSTYDFFRPKDTTPTNIAFGLPGTARYAQDQRFRVYTGETRFASSFAGPVQIVAGAYYQNDRTKFQDGAIQTDPASGKPPCNFYYECIGNGSIGALEFATSLNHKVEQYAVYGQVDWKLLPKLTATAGVRYFHAKISDTAIALQDIPDWFAGVVTTPHVTQDDVVKQHKVSYNFALRYEFQPDFSVYARAASGFRVGGTNNSENAAQNFGVIVPGSYAPDSLKDYEGGVKVSLLDRKLFVDWSVFYIDWKGQQLPGTDPTGAFSYTINAGKTHTKGSELQLTAKAAKGLNLSAGVTYTDAKLAANLPAEVLAGGVIGFKGDRLPRTPKWIFNVAGEYSAPVTDTLSAYIGGDLSHHGASFYEFESDPSGLKLRAYTLVNARVGIRSGPFDASVFVQNIGDKAADLGIYSSIDGTKVYSAQPRTIGLKLTGNF